MRGRSIYLGYYLDIYGRENPISWLLPGYGYIFERERTISWLLPG